MKTNRSTGTKAATAVHPTVPLTRARLLASTALVAATASILALACAPAQAGQLPLTAFSTYSAANAGSITPGPFALYSAPLNTILPTQMNEGYQEVGKKTSAWDLLGTAGQVQNALLTGGDIEPVVIGPGGKLYLTDGHHTFSSLANSIWGPSNPTVYVVVIANYSSMTDSQFWTAMQSHNFLLPLQRGVAQTVNTNTGSPIASTLALAVSGNNGMTNDPYRGLEYSILKNKNSVLFRSTSNMAGVVGSGIPGLDKTTGFYSDFIWANAFRSALGGKGLPYLSPGDIHLSTQWALNGANPVSGVGNATTVSQLPGYIPPSSITINGVISDTTLASTASQSGVLDGSVTGTFNQTSTFASFNGLRGLTAGSVTIGSNAPGFILQLGADSGGTVTLTGANTYTKGTTIVAGTLIVNSDAALGAAVPGSWSFDPTNIASSVRAGNGIVFDSLSEGAGTLRASAALTTARPIAVKGETAIIDANGFAVTLNGPLVSLGNAGTGLGNANGVSDLSFQSGSGNGVVTLAPTSGANPYFYGNLIVSGGSGSNYATLTVSSDAAMGNTTGSPWTIGSVILDGGTFKPGASFASVRNVSLTGSSTFDTNGTTTSFNSLTNVQRVLTVANTSSSAAGSVSFTNGTTIGATSTIQVNGGAQGATINLGAITRGNASGGAGAATATLLLAPTSAGSLGVTDNILASGAATTLTNGIVAPWIVIDNGNKVGGNLTSNYDFATYNSTTGFGIASYTTDITAATATSVIKQSASATLSANTSAYALNIQKGFAVTVNSGKTLTLGDGVNPAGLIMNGGSGSGVLGSGTLAFGASEGVITVTGSSAIATAITGTGGLTVAGAGNLTLSAAEQVTGTVTVDSGTLILNAVNTLFSPGYAPKVVLGDVKSAPSASKLTVNFANTLAELDSVGNNSTVTINGAGVTLTIGDTTNNYDSVISSTITETGSATGALTKNGSGLLDLSGIKSGKLTLITGSTIVVNGGTLRVSANSFTNTNDISLTGGNLQFAQSGGGVFAGNITGTGSMRLIGGTLQLTGTGNSYSGGTFVETGSTLSLTTANVSSGNANITAAGGQIVFDQSTTGTYSGVISDGQQMGTGSTLSGSLVKDDSTGGNGGNVTLSTAQTFTGATTVEAGILTLGATDALATSRGIDMGRIGGGATAALALTQDQTIQSLWSETGNTVSVTLAAGKTLTLGTSDTSKANANADSSFSGSISGGALVKAGTGTAILSGANSFAGVGGGADVTVTAGALVMTGASTYANNKITVAGGATVQGNAGNLALSIVSAGTVIFNQTTDATYAGVISGGGDVVKTGGAILTINAAQTYTGGTYVNGGTLRLGASGSLVNYDKVVVAAGALFDGNGKAITTNTLSGGGTVAVGSSTLTVGASNASSTFTGALTGSGTLAKTGTGTLTVSGDNTAFTGNTSVGGGTLAVAGTLGPAGGTGTVAVGAGGTLTGSGTVNGSVAVSGGTVNGTGTINGAVSVGGGGAVAGAPIINGNVSVGGGGAVAGAPTINGAVSISAGGAVAGAPIINGNVTVDSGGTLGGSGTITGTVAVGTGATLSPGNSPGILSVVGTLGQTAGSTLSIDVDGLGTGIGAGNYDRIVVIGAPGTYTAAGTLAPKLRGITGDARNSFTPSLGQTFTIVAATGGVNGSFSGLTQPTDGMPGGARFDALYGGQTIALILTPARFGNLAAAGLNQTRNQAAVGGALDSIRPAAGILASGDTKSLFDALNLSSGDAGALRGGLDSLAGALHAEASTAVLQTQRMLGAVLDDRLNGLRDGGAAREIASRMTNVAMGFANGQALAGASRSEGARDGISDGLAGGDAPSKLRTWANAFGGFGSVDGDGNGPGSKRTSGGVMAGADMSVAPGLDLGVNLGYGQTWVDANTGGGRDSVDSYLVGAYAAYTTGPVFATATVSHSFDRYDASRTVSVGTLSRQATAKADGGDTALTAKAGYRLSVASLGVEPSVGLRYDHLTRDGFTESNAGLLGLTVGSGTMDAIRSSVGVRVNGAFTVGQSYIIEPSVQLGWNHDLGDYAGRTTASIGGASFAVAGAKPGRDGAVFGAGVVASNGSGFALFANYGGEARAGGLDHVVKAGLRVNW